MGAKWRQLIHQKPLDHLPLGFITTAMLTSASLACRASSSTSKRRRSNSSLARSASSRSCFSLASLWCSIWGNEQGWTSARTAQRNVARLTLFWYFQSSSYITYFSTVTSQRLGPILCKPYPVILQIDRPKINCRFKLLISYLFVVWGFFFYCPRILLWSRQICTENSTTDTIKKSERRGISSNFCSWFFF